VFTIVNVFNIIPLRPIWLSDHVALLIQMICSHRINRISVCLDVALNIVIDPVTFKLNYSMGCSRHVVPSASRPYLTPIACDERINKYVSRMQ